MTLFQAQRQGSDNRAPASGWSARGRQLGIGVMIAFTVKGICTSAMIIAALLAAMDDSGADLFPHLLVWTMACIGGFCMLGGWRHVRKGAASVCNDEISHNRTH